MPLLLVPYTLGTELPAAPAGVTGGAAYFLRRKRFLMYMLTSLAFLMLLP